MTIPTLSIRPQDSPGGKYLITWRGMSAMCFFNRSAWLTPVLENYLATGLVRKAARQAT